MIPSLLFVSTSSRTARLYHRLLQESELEFIHARSVADALLHLVAKPISVVVVDTTVPVFELSLLLKLLKEHSDWHDIMLVSIGYGEMRHLYPPETLFIDGETDFARKMSDLEARL